MENRRSGVVNQNVDMHDGAAFLAWNVSSVVVMDDIVLGDKDEDNMANRPTFLALRHRKRVEHLINCDKTAVIMKDACPSVEEHLGPPEDL